MITFTSFLESNGINPRARSTDQNLKSAEYARISYDQFRKTLEKELPEDLRFMLNDDSLRWAHDEHIRVAKQLKMAVPEDVDADNKKNRPKRRPRRQFSKSQKSKKKR